MAAGGRGRRPERQCAGCAVSSEAAGRVRYSQGRGTAESRASAAVYGVSAAAAEEYATQQAHTAGAVI